MKSITIHGLSTQLDRLIRKRAKNKGLSLNKTIKGLLAESLGLKRDPKSDNSEEFLDLFGIWNDSQKNEFFNQIEDLNKIDEEDWK
jgi:hypothetical protein